MSTVLMIVIGWLLASVALAVVWALLARYIRRRHAAAKRKRRPDIPRQRDDDAA